MNKETICKELVADGWREYPNQATPFARCFFKPIETRTRCHENHDKPGIQVMIAVYDGFAGKPSMEMEISAGLKDDTWLKLMNYSLPKTVPEVTALIPRLLRIWEAANE